MGLELTVLYDPTVMTLIPSDNGYATWLNSDIFDDQAQWRFTHRDDGVLTLRYVSSASTGDYDGGRLFTLTFLLHGDTEVDESYIGLYAASALSAVNGFTYEPSCVDVVDGYLMVASRSTLPKTTTTTVGTTDPVTVTTTTTCSTTTTTVLYLTMP